MEVEQANTFPLEMVVIPMEYTDDFTAAMKVGEKCRLLFEGIPRGFGIIECYAPTGPDLEGPEYGYKVRCHLKSLVDLEAGPRMLSLSACDPVLVDCLEDIDRTHDHMRIVLKAVLVMYRVQDTLYVCTPGGSYVVPMHLIGESKNTMITLDSWTNMSDIQCVVRVDVGGNITLHATRLFGLVSPNWPICNTPWPVQTLKPHVKVESAKPKSQMQLFTPMYAPPPSFAPGACLHFNEPVDLRKMQSVLCLFPYEHKCGAPQASARIATHGKHSDCDMKCTPRFRLSEWGSNRTVSCESGHYENGAVPGSMCSKCKTEPLRATFECKMDDLTTNRELLIDPNLVQSIMGIRAKDYIGEPKLIPTLWLRLRRSTGYLMREAPPKSKLIGHGPVQLQYVIFALY